MPRMTDPRDHADVEVESSGTIVAIPEDFVPLAELGVAALDRRLG